MVVVHMLHRARGVAKSPWVSISSHLPRELEREDPKKTKKTILRSLSRGRRRSGREDRVERRTPALAVGRLAPRQSAGGAWELLNSSFSGNFRFFFFFFFLEKQDEVSGLESAATENERCPGGEKRSAERRDPVPEGRGGRDIKRVQRAGGQSAMKAARTQARSRASARTNAGARVAAGGLRLGRPLAEARRHPRIIPRAAGNPAGDPYGVSSHEAAIAG